VALFGAWISKRIHLPVPDFMELEAPPAADAKLPHFGLILAILLLPLLLMLAGSLVRAQVVVPGQAIPDDLPGLASAVIFLGHPIIALLITTLVTWVLLGLRRGFSSAQLMELSGKALGSAGLIILITGAGGVFKEMLNPLFPRLRPGHRLFQRPSRQKQITSSRNDQHQPDRRADCRGFQQDRHRPAHPRQQQPGPRRHHHGHGRPPASRQQWHNRRPRNGLGGAPILRIPVDLPPELDVHRDQPRERGGPRDHATQQLLERAIEFLQFLELLRKHHT